MVSRTICYVLRSQQRATLKGEFTFNICIVDKWRENVLAMSVHQPFSWYRSNAQHNCTLRACGKPESGISNLNFQFVELWETILAWMTALQFEHRWHLLRKVGEISNFQHWWTQTSAEHNCEANLGFIVKRLVKLSEIDLREIQHGRVRTMVCCYHEPFNLVMT